MGAVWLPEKIGMVGSPVWGGGVGGSWLVWVRPSGKPECAIFYPPTTAIRDIGEDEAP